MRTLTRAVDVGAVTYRAPHAGTASSCCSLSWGQGGASRALPAQQARVCVGELPADPGRAPAPCGAGAGAAAAQRCGLGAALLRPGARPPDHPWSGS